MKMRALLAFLLVLSPALAYPENCRQVGCAGGIYFIHVPSAQRTAPLVFDKPGLPKKGLDVKVHARVSLLTEATFTLPKSLPYLSAAINRVVETGEVLQNEGSELEAGSIVTVLGYRKFPLPGKAAKETFVEVLVHTDGTKESESRWNDYSKPPIPTK